MLLAFATLSLALCVYQADQFSLFEGIGSIEKSIAPRLPQQLDKTRENIARAKNLKAKVGKPVVYTWYEEGPDKVKSYQQIWLGDGDKTNSTKAKELEIEKPKDVAEEDKEFFDEDSEEDEPTEPPKPVYCFISPEGEICHTNKTRLIEIITKPATAP